MKKYFTLSIKKGIISLLMLGTIANAQITNLNFSSDPISYSEISGGTNIVPGGSALGAASAVTPIGFNFVFQGNTYANFSVNAAGLLKFGAVAVTNESVNNASSITNAPKLYAWWDATYTTTTASGGGVKYELTGTAPNRVLTVQWKVAYAANAATGFSYQVKLYETSNVIEYLYGSAPGSPQSASVGLGNFGANEYISIYTLNHIPSSKLNYNTNTIFPGAGSGMKYTFIPGNFSTICPDCFSSKPSFWLKADGVINGTRTLLNVPAGNRTASSVLSASWPASASVMTATNGWIPSTTEGASATPTASNQLGAITLDLGSVQTIHGVATLGAGSAAYYVQDYYVRVSNDNVTWTNLGLFEGNELNTALHYSDFSAPVSCRYVRVIPSAFTTYRALRLDVYTKTTTTPANNDKVAIWEDGSGNEEDAFQNSVPNQPTFNTNQINFNPAVNFSTTASTALNIPDMANIRQTYWVAQDLTPTGGNYNHVLFGNSTAPYYHGGPTGQLQFSSAMTAAQAAWRKDGAAATMATAYDFGPQGNPNLVASNTLNAANPMSAISIAFQAGQTRSWNGPIAEIISFQNSHNATQQNQVESYLGIKYGLTLDHDYFAGSGITVWNKTTNAAYHNNVFGIGRSDCQGLHQRQSFSSNYSGKFITLGNNSIIGNTNAASVGNDLAADNTYLIIGDDKGDLLYSETLVGNYYPLGRKWKVSNIGITAATKVSVPAFGNSTDFTLPNSLIDLYDAETVYLVIDADGDGNFVNATYSAMTKVGTGPTAAWEISKVLPNNAVIGFAVKQNISDTDGDGVLDLVDIDDDNDGILDTQEQVSCLSYGKNLASATFSGVSVTNKTNNSITTNTNGWNSSYSTENFSLPISLKFNRIATEGSAMIGLIPAGSTTQTPANYNDNAYKFYLNTVTAYGYFGTAWNFTQGSLTGSEEYSIDISATGYVTVKINGVQKQAFQGVNSAYKLVVSAGTSSALFSNIRLTNATYLEKTICFDRDTDGDGTPNRLDLDSDDDGCSDAYEAGTTTIRTQNYSHPNSGVGANGFANSLEATADNGIYNGTYNSLYVIDKFTKACLDTDGDNISDLVDLDDDNDGVKDEEECVSPLYDNWTDLAVYKSKMMSSAFHGTLFRSNSGKYYVAGQYAKPDGTDQLTPTLVTPANGYNYTGEIIDIAGVGSASSYVIATTDGIWVWGATPNNFILPGISGNSFQKVTLPSEIDPKNIRSISASTNNFMILLHDGSVYAYAMGIPSLNGAGLTVATKGFTKVLVAPNTPLTNIDQIEATSNGSIAADITNNKLYTWGTNIYLGNGTATTTKNYATEMINPLPNGVGIAMIDATYNASMTYLVLGTDKKVYSLGSASEGILGQNSLVNTTSWANVKGRDGVGVLENVEYLSAQNSTDLYTSASVILSSGLPLSWGSAGANNMIGLGNTNALVPGLPNGISETDVMYVVENGGHLTPMLNSKGEIGNVGHNVAGAFGDGSTQNRAAYVFSSFERGSDLSDNIAASCNPDIDGDGIANRLDLDTDGDGCSDAKEAGVSGSLLSGNLINKVNGSLTTTSVTNAIAQGGYGANGLADGVETSANSGTINYLSNYTAVAQNVNLNLCADFDNDGVSDIMDIDDDNDGVLDAIESPDCYYTAAYYQSGDRKANFTVSSEIPRVSPQNQLASLIDGDGTTGAINFVNSSTLINKVLYKVTFDYPVPLTQMVLRLTNTSSFFNAASTVTVQGSNDDVTWTNLNAGVTYNTLADNTIVAPFWTAATANEIFTVTQNQGRYKFYRLYGTAGSVNNTGVATEFYFNTSSSFEPSYYPKPSCIATDTDGDGAPNNIDLDSDGDGCSDAKEAGTSNSSTANFVFTGTVGANGFDNSLEATADNGIYNGTYTYVYASNNIYNLCIDTDSDGIADLIDIDDDNDGVLDTVEENACTVYSFTNTDQVVTVPSGVMGMRVKIWGAGGSHETVAGPYVAGAGGYTYAEFNNTVVTPGANFTVVVGKGGNRNTAGSYGFGFLGTHDQGGGLSGIFSGNQPVTATSQTRALAIAGGGAGADHDGSTSYAGGTNGNGANSGGVINSMMGSSDNPEQCGSSAAYPENGWSSGGGGYQGGGRMNFNTLQGSTMSGCNINWASGKGGSGFVANSAAARLITFTPDGTQLPPFTTDSAYVTGVGIAGTSSSINGGNGLVQICWIVDTDGDGVPNTLDLDSDGDGCSDAKEAGSSTTATSTSTYPSGTDTNGNGLLNNYEGTTAGTINYTSVYTNYALNNTFNACFDNDNDGIPDLNDIDDDNDGILDITEQGTCTYPDNNIAALTYTGQAVITSSANTITALSNQNTVWKSSYSDQIFKLPIHLEYTTVGNVANTFGMIGLLPVGNTQTVGNWNDGAYKIYHNGANIQLYKQNPSNSFYLTKAYTAGQKMEIDISATGMVTIKQAGVVIKKFKGKVADYKLALSHWASAVSRTYSNVQLTSWSLNGVCADIDTDGDGVPNRFDLDSDNDGCKDHVEGGAATSNATTIPYGNVGTNGLADALENPADSGFIIYEDIYDTYAIDNTIEACDDHDNDGILDYIDIDDDNDGVLDTEEQANCTVPNVVLDDLTWTGNTTVSAFETTVSGISTTGAANTGSWTSSYSNEELELPIHLEFTTATNNIEGMIGLIPATAAQPANIWNDLNSYKYYFTDNSGIPAAQTYRGKFPSTSWNIPSTNFTATQKFELDINEQGVLTATVNGVMMHRIQAPIAPYKFVVSGKTAEKQYDNVVLVAKSPNTICEDIDTDGDGIPNRFDLDSDNDGCNDAVEAGVGNVSTTVPLTGAVGANGLVDTKETAVDNGRINYSSTYAFYGVSETENVCLDSDGDSIGNLTDIDDDNDGVLDAIEMGCSVPLFVNKTSENTTTSKKLTGTILKETGTVDYEIAMSGAGVTNPGVYDGGNGIHFRVDGVTNALYMNLKLTATAAENSSTTSPPKVKTIDFGPSVPLNTAAGTAINQKSNITLTWPGAYGVVYDPNNQLSSHNTGDIIKSGDLLVQDVDVTAAQIAAGQTWKVKMYMHTTADVYDIKASVFGDAALGSEAFGFNTQVCSPADTDADGLPNHLDTDSDGDGCYDAYESSSVNSSTQATVAGPYGNNGFASSLETNDNFDAGMTTAFSNTISYNQAISNAVNSCSDTDGDGIKDSEDIDDDNDGIVDADEMSCGVAYFTMPTLTSGATANLQNLTGTASLGNAGVDYELNLVGVNTVFTNATTNTQFDNSKDGIHFAFTDNDNVYSQTYKLAPSAPTLIKKVRFGVNVPTNQISTAQVNDAQSIVLTWSPDIKAVVYDPNDQLSTHATGDVITSGTTITTRANYTIAASTWKIEFLANGLAREFYLQTTHKTTSSTNVGVEGYGLSADICFVDDTDGDGKSDHLDTDSDDDGCGDAYESGATSTPGGATQTIAGPYGTNGLANSLETNDTQDASTTYASTAYMAYSPVSACADTDNDGIPDRDDIDDDNDGILDATEYGCGIGTFVKSYVITSGLGMGFGGTFNNGNSKGTGTMSFTDLSSVTTVSDVTDAANYKVNDANTTYKFKASIAPSNGIISQLVFGPNLPGNTANAAVVNGQQSITVNWNFPVGGIVYDPNDQLSSHTDGQGINPGDVIVTRANYAVSASTWKVIIPFNYINKQVDFTAQFVGVANLGDESFGISTNICNKVTDVDGDKKANAVDTDSDGDGCYDLVESNSGYYTSLTQETIVGPYGVNGYSATAETNDTLLANANYITSLNYLNNTIKGCLDTDGDGVPNVDDIDDDNDGILDQTECPTVPPVTKFGFQQIAGTNGRQMYITNKATNVPIGKITIAPVKNIGVDTLIGNENDNSVSGHWVDGAFVNNADRVMTIKFEPVAPYTALDLKVLATEGGNGPWGFHPRSLRVDGGIAGDGVIKAIPQRYYLRENYQVGQTLTPSMRMSTAFTGMLGGSTNKVFIQVQYNAQATVAAPLVLKYTWNALAGSVANENFGFQLLELNPSLTTGPCDYDHDGINDDLDSDSDNDGCPDTKEAVHGKPFAPNTNYIKGPYGANGFSTLMENNDTLTATYATSGWLPKVTTSPKKDYVNELINTRCIIPFIAPAGPTTFCDPGSVILNINLNGGATPTAYQWYKNGVAISGATANTYTATETGDYTVLLTYADTSTILTDPQDVTENTSPAVPTITAAPGTTICLGGTSTLTSSYATGNQWYFNNVAITGATAPTYAATVSGDYKVGYTDPATGCTSYSTITVVVIQNLPAAPSVTVTQPTCTTATGTIVVTPSGNAGDTYSIDGTNYQASNTFAGLTPGTYSVTTKSAIGCTSSVTSSIVNTQPQAATVPTISVASGTAICSGSTTTLTSSELTGNQWYKDGVLVNGATGVTYTTSLPGVYTVNTTNSDGCSATSTGTTITVAPTPTASIAQSITINNTNCGTASPVLLTATTDAVNPIYTWYNNGSLIVGITTNTYLATGSGSYTVKVTSAAGCSFTSVPSVVTTGPSVTVTSGAICQGQTITLSANITGFTNPTFVWEYSANGTSGWAMASGAATNTTYAASVAGFYRVIVSDSSQTITSCPSEVIVNSLPVVTVTANPSGVICAGSSTVLTANVTANSSGAVTYQWFNGSNLINGAITSTYTVTNSGTYSVQVTNSNGCQVTSAGNSITVNQLPNTPKIDITNPTCTTPVGTITISDPIGAGFTYKLNGGTAQASPVFAGLQPGNYTVIAINANGCESAAYNATVNAVPTATTISGSITGNTTPLTGVTETYSIAPISGAVSYVWTLPNGWTGSSNTNTIIATTGALVNNTGTILAAIIDANGCQSNAITLNVAIKPVPPTANNYTYCQYATATAVTATAISGGTLNWYTAATGAATPSSLIPSTTTPGIFSYYVSQTVGGVESDRKAVIVTITAAPATPSITTTQPSCSVATGTIFIDAPRGTGLTYSINGVDYSNTSGQFVNLAPGTYTVTVKDSGACISQSTTVTIVPFSSAIATAIATVTQPTCTVLTGVITVTSPLQSGLTYSIDGFDYSNTNGVFNNVTPGTYQITIKNAAGCVNSPTTVVVNQPLVTPAVPVVTITQPTCSVATGTITVTSPVGMGMTYSIDGSTYTNTTGIFTGLNPGIYYVSAKSADGCVGDATAAVVNTQPAMPSAVIATVTNPTCSVATGTITVLSPLGTGNTYSINGITYTNTTGIFTNVAAGTYSVTVKNSQGCISSASSVTVAAQPNTPSAPTATVTQPTCSVATGTITVNSPVSGNTYSIDGINYVSNGIFNNVVSGTYSLIAKNNVGCESTPTTVLVNTQPTTPSTAVITTVQPTCSVATGTITVTSPVGTGYTYSIDGSTYTNTTGIFSNVPAGTYSVTVKNNSGCTSSAITAVINAQPATLSVPTIISTGSTICAGNVVTLTASAANGYKWYNNNVLIVGATSQTYTTSLSGSFTVVATSVDGCESLPSSPEVVTVNSIPTAAISEGATLAFSNCATTAMTLTANTNATNPTYQWTLDGNVLNGETNSTLTVTQPGDYAVIITSNNCSATSSISRVLAAPSLNTNGSSSVCQGETVTLTANSSGFTNPTYQWQVDTGSGYTNITTNGTSNTYLATTSGDYRVEVTDNSVVSNSCPITVTVNTLPTATITTAATEYCVGSIAVLTANSDAVNPTYQWYVGTTSILNETNATYSPTQTGTYSVLITNQNGCQTLSTGTTITYYNPPAAPTVTVSQPTCSVTTGAITVTNPIGTGYTYSIDGVDYSNTTGVFTSLTPGSYTIIAKSNIGCIGLPITVTINSQSNLICDSDGDGVDDAQEAIDGTDPTDFCDYNASSVTSTPSTAWLAADCDGDGTPNSTDTDPQDPCVYTAGSTPNTSNPVWQAADCDGDGLTNDTEGLVDTDGDGIPDFEEIDSDGDGIPDSTEAGSNPNNPVDTDGDGTPDYQDTDSDGDGIPDATEDAGCTGTAPCTPTDTDGDGTPNYLDQDSDGDGIPDSIEDAACTGVTPCTPTDTDNDGTPDYLDTDSDGDGIPDATEDAGCTGTAPCTPTDTDGDGTPNYLDQDSDGDGIPDSIEDAACTGVTPCTPTDTDGDGIPNYLDLDSDNDGILDSYENSVCTPAVPLCDTDGDGIPNYMDLDSDNDGVTDVYESGGIDADNDGEVDGPIGTNGIPQNSNGGVTPPNTDGDGNVDPYDIDDDGDGINTSDEDADNDGDPRNDDTDGDGTPNYLDLDADGDGVTDAQEILDGTDPNDPCDFEVGSITLPQAASWNNADCDGDGVTNGQEIIDGTDPTDGCDAVMSHSTLPLSQAFLEGDCDGDGLSNGEEIGPNPNQPFDPNGNGIPDYLEPNNHTPSTDDLEIFNLVTPNGDGDNDVFVIRNIELYPENSLEIFNRWGVQVYGVDGYGQNGKYFRGISEGRFTIQQSAELPVGTYWYVLKYKNAQGVEKQRVGYLYINK